VYVSCDYYLPLHCSQPYILNVHRHQVCRIGWVAVGICNGESSLHWDNSIFTVIITFLTEVSSNTGTLPAYSSPLTPLHICVFFAQAENLGVNPLYFALPGTVSPSFAFMLPVATPPNAIVYETGVVRILDMVCHKFDELWMVERVSTWNKSLVTVMLRV